MANSLRLVVLILYLSALSFLSLYSIGDISTLGSDYDDKLNHLLAHALLTLLCYYYLIGINAKYPTLISIAISVAYGIIIEVLQLTITEDRTFDAIDILFNFVGALFAVSLLKLRGYLKLN